jgi:acetyl-CoA acetyltransferase
MKKPDCAIVSIGRATTSRSDANPRTPLQLGSEAAAAAIRQAGISRDAIGALFTGRTPQTYMTLQYNQSLLNELKIAPAFSSEVTPHGAGALGTLQFAALALQSGMIDYALCVTNEAGGAWVDMASANATWEADLQFEAPYGAMTPSLYGNAVCRYIHENDIRPEMAARVAVENRRWALHHPRAAMRHKGEITVEDVLNSPMIASPFRLLDCAVWYPGGIGTAVILTRGEIARKHHDEATYMVGFGQCSTHEWITERMGTRGVAPVMQEPNLVDSGASVAASQAYAMAGLKSSDMDLVQTSAPFSYVNLMMLEDLGFCARGEAGDFVLSGGIDFEGGLPFNTSGGYLSFGQIAQGLYLFQETADQLWNRAEGRQVPDAKLGLVHGHGGPLACHSVVILSNAPAY